MAMAIKVLLVEDDRALREALADTLLLAGHGFRAVASAEEALEAVAGESFSLVISDVNMPGMDGHQLLGRLRWVALGRQTARDRWRLSRPACNCSIWRREWPAATPRC